MTQKKMKALVLRAEIWGKAIGVGRRQLEREGLSLSVHDLWAISKTLKECAAALRGKMDQKEKIK